ncbi:uncharacterized protein JCM6883_006526 [Sporobolomyces salmoneus]|uniref:uncharacterized protein n=1 Tax=Sporobolomyces salmoneus TaxID=183962 RepID=UPI00316F982D
MSNSHDPTNANAVPGSSKHPYNPALSTPADPPAPPSLPRIDPSTSAPPSEPIPVSTTHSHPTPRRSANGPLIIPTVVAQDGVREVPQAFEHCQVEDLIALIASMLDRLIEHNDRIPLTPNSLTRFHSRAPPSIGVRDYLLRIARYTNVEPCCLLILLPYVDKVCARMNTFTISSLTVHRFIIAAVSVGSKALSDAFCTNGRYSRVGGVSVVEMNLLEKEFCEAIDWRLTTSGSVLAHYYTSLVRSHPRYRLSTVALPADLEPERDPPTEPSNLSTSSSTPHTASSSASKISPSINGSTTHSVATSPSVSSSSSRSIPNSASSSSLSIDPSPALSTTSLPRTDHPPPHPLSSSASPRLPLKAPRPLSSDSTTTGISTPPLVPPNLPRRLVSASNLPSPNPSSNSTTNRGSSTTRSPRFVSSPRLNGIHAESNHHHSNSMPPPQSPAKRGRRRSTSSEASSSGGGSTYGGTGGGGGVGTSTSSNPNTRFAPSPRLSAET